MQSINEVSKKVTMIIECSAWDATKQQHWLKLQQAAKRRQLQLDGILVGRTSLSSLQDPAHSMNMTGRSDRDGLWQLATHLSHHDELIFVADDMLCDARLGRLLDTVDHEEPTLLHEADTTDSKLPSYSESLLQQSRYQRLLRKHQAFKVNRHWLHNHQSQPANEAGSNRWMNYLKSSWDYCAEALGA